MKKQLDVNAMINELKGGSVFFQGNTVEAEDDRQAVEPNGKVDNKSEGSSLESQQATNHPIKHANKHDSKQARLHEGKRNGETTEAFDAIRKAVKTPGREVTYLRLTKEEKDQLSDIIYSYKRLGIKTSETEIGRIAMNYIVEDYQTNGENSILNRIA